jgi:hypothetical protein
LDYAGDLPKNGIKTCMDSWRCEPNAYIKTPTQKTWGNELTLRNGLRRQGIFGGREIGEGALGESVKRDYQKEK